MGAPLQGACQLPAGVARSSARGFASRRNEVCVSGQMTPLVVSIVVPTCGRTALLSRCLDALCAQSLPADCFEVIVVDDQPVPAGQALAACCAQARRHGLPVRLLRNPGPHGPAAARNVGWRAARAAWVGFTDDDTIPQLDWLERACAVLMPATTDMTAMTAMTAAAYPLPSSCRPDPPDALWGRVQVPLPPQPTDYERDASRLQQAGFVTANCFCRRALLQDIGGFDERFQLAWREDTDLYFRLCDAGARVIFVADAVVLHPVRPAGWAVSLAQQRKIMFDALLYKKHRRRYRLLVRRRARWDYYGSTALLLGGSAALLAGSMPAAMLALSAWLFSVGAFFRQRLRGTSRRPRALAALVFTSALIPPLAVFWRAVGAIRFRVLWL